MSYLIGLDVGTSGIKGIAVDPEGKVLAKSFVEYPLSQPKPGWAEQDPEDWWKATLSALSQLSAAMGSKASEVVGMALSGQMHGSVFLGKSGEVLRPAILWCDVRTTAQCAHITEAVGGREKLIQLTANPALEGFTAPKIVWVQQNQPEIFEATKTILLPKDYIRYRLTGELLSEVSDAAGTLLFDVKNRKWSEPVLKALGIPVSVLPEVRESVDECGKLKADIAAQTGLPAGIPVAGGGADNACGAAGAGIVKEGRVLSSIGSSGVVLAHTNNPLIDPAGKVHTFNHSVPHKWYVMGVMLAAGLSFKWVRDNLGQSEKMLEELSGIDAYELLSAEAARAPVGSEGLIFLPYLNGERTPHGDAYAKGVFFGLTGRHGKAHVVRSVMEGVVYGLRDSLEIIRSLGIDASQIRAIGGGGKSPLWRQMQADVMGVEVATVNIDEGPAFGAALMAGVAAGVYESLEDAAEAAVRVVQTTQPVEANTRRYQGFYELYRELYPALKSSFRKVSDLV